MAIKLDARKSESIVYRGTSYFEGAKRVEIGKRVCIYSDTYQTHGGDSQIITEVMWL